MESITLTTVGHATLSVNEETAEMLGMAWDLSYKPAIVKAFEEQIQKGIAAGVTNLIELADIEEDGNSMFQVQVNNMGNGNYEVSVPFLEGI